MKKKGLIISTVVMVVVLIASLTTATYAWFTAASKTSVEKIKFSVTSDSDVLIGVATDNAWVSNPTLEGFVCNDGISYDADTNKWSGGTAGLGNTINTGLELTGMTKAVGTGVLTTDLKTVDGSWTFDHAVVVASGSDSTAASVDASTIDAAVRQDNYLDVTFGIKPNKENLTSITCYVVIHPTGEALTLGMNAAIHVRSCVEKDDTDSTNWSEKDLYDGYTYKKAKSEMTAPTAIDGVDVEFEKGDVVFAITIAPNNGGAVLDADTIYQAHLIIFVAGYDTDCNNNAGNISSEISIHFATTKKAAEPTA